MPWQSILARPARLPLAAVLLSPWLLTSGGHASAAALPAAVPGVELLAAGTWDTFSADIAIRRHLVMADGTTGARAPLTRYRWTRTLRAGHWRSTMALHLPGTAGAALTLEDDEDGSPVRVYNAQGVRIRMPRVEDRRILGDPAPGTVPVPELPDITLAGVPRPARAGREWVLGLIATAARRQERRATAERRFGRPAGTTGGRLRFVRPEAVRAVEVLTDPDSALPVEINTVRQGVLVAHTVLSYERTAGGALVRRHIRVERLLSGTGGQRAVADVELSNLRLTRRERR